MVERTEIEKNVRYLIALDVVSRVLKSLGDKGVRREKKTAKNIVDLLNDKEPLGDRVVARLETRDEQKARTLRQGIDVFKEKYPKYGDELENFIKETRTDHNLYLVYGLRENYKLSEDDYVSVMKDLGFSDREAKSIYSHIVAVSERANKAIETSERNILVNDKEE